MGVLNRRLINIPNWDKNSLITTKPDLCYLALCPQSIYPIEINT